MKFIVYKTTCLVNGKIYVGVHQTEDPEVFDGYIGDGIATYFTYYLRNPKWAFHYAVAKYGIENFRRETLFVFDTEKEAYKKEEEIVNLEFIQRDDTYNVALGGEYIKKISAPIYQFDLNGKFLARYESAYEASEITGIWDTTIRSSAREKVARNGYLWSWNETINPDEYYIKTYKKYYIYDSDGFFVTEFDNLENCAKFLEVNSKTNNIYRSIKNKYRVHGYFVSYEKYDSISIQVTKNNGKLNRYTVDGKYIDSFESVKEARNRLGLKLGNISAAIRSFGICNGYRWTRSENPPTQISITN